LYTVEVIERILWHATQYGFRVCLVNPAYTSKLAELVARDLGLDKHTASAYILALEFLGLDPKELYQHLQRP